MKIFVACEESQAVTIEMRKLGHEAYSCDIIDQSGGHPEWHIKQDVLPLLNGDCTFLTTDGKRHEIKGEWDMIIAFPPCTFLTVTGNRWFNEKRYGEKAIESWYCLFWFLLGIYDENDINFERGDIPKVVKISKNTDIVTAWKPLPEPYKEDKNDR